MIDQLFSELAAWPEVEAIALGGSRAGDVCDEKSDYDVYLYVTEPVKEKTRSELLSKYCSVLEIGNHFWEYEDNCTLNNGIDIDILYRNLDDFVKDVASAAEQYQAGNGYTTCMWHNLITCKIIYDKEGRLASARQRFLIPYPRELRKNIICRGMKLLHTAMPAYDGQIAKAIQRNDFVSINHRTAAFMEAYFDVLFAVNEQTHPGEKRLIQLCKKHCALLPEGFEENLNRLFQDLFTDTGAVPEDLAGILSALERLLQRTGLIFG